MIDHDIVDEWREQARKKEDEARRRVDLILRDNPSLTRAQAEAWDARQLESRPRLPPKCCPCRQRGRAEVVAVGEYLGPCKCGCHGGGP